MAKYWSLVQLNGAGTLRVEEVAIAQAFFQQQFAHAAPLSDEFIQQQFWQWFQSTDESKRLPAELCLRCWISHRIVQVCRQLASKFGDRHGFTCTDLFPLVLNDVIERRHSAASTPYRSLASKISQTFNPKLGRLSAWVKRHVEHDLDLSAFLQEHGVYMATDWGLLCDTSPNHLRKILAEFYTAMPIEIEQAYNLLQGYHAVYRIDRLQQRQQRLISNQETCRPPTLGQLTRIRAFLQAISLSATADEDTLLNQLQKLAAQIRQYRLYRRNGSLPTEPIDPSDIEGQTTQPEDNWEDEEAFLAAYRQAIINNLDAVLKKVTSDRVTYLQGRTPPKAQSFLIALQLFYCREQSMGAIAPRIGLNAQYRVSRLLKLREFRATVKSRLFQRLRDWLVGKASPYIDPNQLQTAIQNIERILEEEVSILIDPNETESASSRRRPFTTLFAHRLCCYLDTLDLTP